MGPQYDHSDIMFTPPYYLEEEDGMDTSYDLKLFPLSQYKFRDPCEKCIVRAMCKGPTNICDKKYKHADWEEYKAIFIHKLSRKLEVFGNFCRMFVSIVGKIFVLLFLAILLGILGAASILLFIPLVKGLFL